MKAGTDDIKDKILFASIFDLIGHYDIIKSMNRYRPQVVIYVKNVNTIAFLSQYFIKNLPGVNVRTRKASHITIKENKNVMPLLMHIKPNCRFQTDVIDTLIRFIYHRTESCKKRYNSIDDDFFKTTSRIKQGLNIKLR